MKLSYKLFLYIFLLGFVPIFLLYMLYFLYFSPSVKSVIEKNISISSEVLYDDLNRQINAIYDDVVSISLHEEMLIKDMQYHVKKNVILKDLTLLDINGKNISSVNYSQERLGSSIWFKKALEDNIVISDVHAVLEPFDIILTISVPVYSSEKIKYILIGTVDIDKLSEIVSETSLKNSGSFEVYNSKGVCVLSDNEDLLLERFSDKTVYQDIINGVAHSETFNENSNKYYYNIYKNDKDAKLVDWRILYKNLYSDTFKELILSKRLFQFIGIILFIFIHLLAYSIHTKFSKRILKLYSATKSLGKGDYSYEIMDKGNDEISSLFREFIRTRETLKSSEEKLLNSNYRYDLAVKGAKDVIWDFNVNNGKIFIGDKWWKLIGEKNFGQYTDLEHWQSHIHKEDTTQFSTELNRCIKGDINSLEIEYRITRTDGKIKWVLTRGASVKDDKSNIVRIAGSHTDITSRKILEQKMAFNAFYDPLTELPNRTMLLDRINLSNNRAQRKTDYDFSLLFLDYDGFKHVNDTYGHAVGDLVLIEISKRLLEILRPLDLVARIGGDEFVIIIDGVKDKDVLTPILNRIIISSKDEFYINNTSIYISVSIGITGTSSCSTVRKQ